MALTNVIIIGSIVVIVTENQLCKVQILDKAVYIPLHINALSKGMDLSVLLPAIGK